VKRQGKCCPLSEKKIEVCLLNALIADYILQVPNAVDILGIGINKNKIFSRREKNK
jgi:hypothetical protein